MFGNQWWGFDDGDGCPWAWNTGLAVLEAGGLLKFKGAVFVFVGGMGIVVVCALDLCVCFMIL